LSIFILVWICAKMMELVTHNFLDRKFGRPHLTVFAFRSAYRQAQTKTSLRFIKLKNNTQVLFF